MQNIFLGDWHGNVYLRDYMLWKSQGNQKIKHLKMYLKDTHLIQWQLLFREKTYHFFLQLIGDFELVPA